MKSASMTDGVEHAHARLHVIGALGEFAADAGARLWEARVDRRHDRIRLRRVFDIDEDEAHCARASHDTLRLLQRHHAAAILVGHACRRNADDAVAVAVEIQRVADAHLVGVGGNLPITISLGRCM
jgi:hypothetical protein